MLSPSLKQILRNPDAPRETLYANGVWISKTGDRIHVSCMSDSYLLNVKRFMERNAGWFLEKLQRWYASCPEPNGEMAQYEFERERDFWFEGAEGEDALHQHPFYPFLMGELERRELHT